MKFKKLFPIIFLLTGSLATAQQNNSEVVKLRGTRLTYPLVKAWIAEFNKEYPEIKVSITPEAPADSIDFNIAAYAISAKEIGESRVGVVVARYTQLPIVNSHRADLAQLQAKGVTEKDVSDLFFSPRVPALFSSSNVQSPTLYVRDRPVCAVKAFATHYGNSPALINGVGIKGDDQDLADSVRRNVNAVSFNNLGFIYDVKTKNVNEGIAVIPLDLNENGKIDADEKIYNTLDEVVAFIERTNHPKFVTERVNFIFNKNARNNAAGIFLKWVLTVGQQYNNRFGFLNLNTTTLAEQREIVAVNFSINPISSCEGATAVLKGRNRKPDAGK